MKKNKIMLAALAGLFTGIAGLTAPGVFGAKASAEATDGDKHACKGLNACKGTGACKTDEHACKGLNECKGKGGCATDDSKKS